MRLLVSGLLNIETTLRVEGFPIEYQPVRYPFGGVASSVSGVGVNVALALGALGDEVTFLSLVGRDEEGRRGIETLEGRGLDSSRVLPLLADTPASVILYDPSGRRQINVDLKDIQNWRYPEATFVEAVRGAGAAVLCNINFNRDLLGLAGGLGLPVFCDVHVLRDPRDDYNRDFMKAAEVLFLSDEGLWSPAAEAARELAGLYGSRLVVIGRGGEGALLLEAGEKPLELPALLSRPVVSTIGAGDALFSAFLHFHLGGLRAPEALRRAQAFASWKIGEAGAAKGFLDEGGVEALLEHRMQ